MNEMYDHVIHVVKGTLVYNKCFMKISLKGYELFLQSTLLEFWTQTYKNECQCIYHGWMRGMFLFPLAHWHLSDWFVIYTFLHNNSNYKIAKCAYNFPLEVYLDPIWETEY